jgi:hypothetical protein
MKPPPGRPKKLFANVRQFPGTDRQTPLTPIVRLNSLERSIFNLTVTRHRHLKPADVVLVTSFAKAAARVLKPSRLEDAAAIEKATRIMVLIARSLRLTPMNALDPRTVGGHRRDALPNPLAEYLAERDADIAHANEQEETDDEEG